MKGTLVWLTHSVRGGDAPVTNAGPGLGRRLWRFLHALFLRLGGCTCGDRAPTPSGYPGPRSQITRTRLHVYLCHPHPYELGGETGSVRKLASELVEEGHVPVTPMLGHQQLGSGTPEQLNELGLAILERCDEVRVYGAWLTKSMRAEVEHASRLGIPTVFINGGQA